MPTEEKSCKNCGFNSSSDNYIITCHDPKPCVDKTDWLPKGSIDVAIIKNKARRVEIEAELIRINEYLAKIDMAIEGSDKTVIVERKTPNQIREDLGMKPVEKNNSDLYTKDVPDPKIREEFKHTGTINSTDNDTPICFSKATIDVGERQCIDCYHRSSSVICVEKCINKNKWILNNSVKTKSVLEDSGERTDFGTGAVRDMHQGKGRCDLLPPNALLRLARHFENGATKYGDRNWELGIPCHSFADSGMRHLLKFMAGDTDEDHLIAAIWNLMCLAETEMLRPEMQDIPSRSKKRSIERYGYGR